MDYNKHYEHYLAHLLLLKIYPDVHGLLYAVHLMGKLGNNKEMTISHIARYHNDKCKFRAGK